MFYRFKKGMFMSLCLVGASASMANTPKSTLMVNDCLLAQIPTSERLILAKGSLSIIEVNESKLESLKILAHKKHCGGFKNVSHLPLSTLKSQLDSPKKTKELSFKRPSSNLNQTIIEENIQKVEGNRIWDTLTTLTEFDDRSATTDTGVEAVHWMRSQFQALAKENNRKDVQTFLIGSGSFYKQPSLVTMIGKGIEEEAIVIGAHIDTLSYQKPGADDDGSGSAGLLEIARVMMGESPKVLKRPIYFIWYAAEERGLVGSEHVVSYFKDKNIPVKAVLHFDMTGYRYHGKDKMYLLDDNVNHDLTAYLKDLIETYIGVEVGSTHCGYACSDHASWNDENIPAACPFEADHWASEDNPYIHTGDDTLDHVSLAHMENFTKLGVAFATDLSR